MFGFLRFKTQECPNQIFIKLIRLPVKTEILGRQTEHQKSLSAAEGNVKKKTDKLTQRGAGCVFCVCSRLSSDESLA